MSDRMVLTGAPARPELLELLERAKHHKMTPAERREQAISFVFGQLMDSGSQTTREEITRRYDEIYGPLTEEPSHG